MTTKKFLKEWKRDMENLKTVGDSPDFESVEWFEDQQKDFAIYKEEHEALMLAESMKDHGTPAAKQLARAVLMLSKENSRLREMFANKVLDEL